jgi:two-component system KDP operon response regulator KdpE
VSDGPHLLYVEDEAGVREPTASSLREHGFRVTPAGTAAEGLAAWEADRADVILLDLGLPDRDGDLVIRRVRAESTVPILVISARSQEADKVRALEIGADDYMTKPFGLAELRARVAALLRRAGGAEADQAGIVRVGPLVLDPGRRVITCNGAALDLTPREYELLKTMIGARGRLLTKGRLLRAVWGSAYGDEGHYLHVYVSRLRRKLDAADPSGAASGLIVAEPGVGYRIGSGDEPAGPTD